MLFAMGIIRDCNPFEIIRHPWFISVFIAGGGAQVIKFVVNWWRTGKAEFR